MRAGACAALSIALFATDLDRAGASGPEAPPAPAPVAIHVDLPTATIMVGSTRLPAALLTLDTRVSGEVTFAGIPAQPLIPIAIDVTVPAVEFASWRLDCRCEGGPWRPVIDSTVPLPARMTWLGTAGGTRMVRPGVACEVRIVATTADGWTALSAPQPVPLAGAARRRPDAQLTGALFTRTGGPTPLLQRALRSFVAAAGRRSVERYQIAAQVRSPRDLSATDREMRAAAASAQLVRHLRGLQLPADRLEVAVDQGPQDSVTLTAVPTPPPPPLPLVRLDGASYALAGGRMSTLVTLPPGSPLVVDITDEAGRRAVYTLTPVP